MNEEIFTTVLNDILEEMRQTTQSVRELQVAVATLRAKTDHFELQLTELKIIIPPPDTKPLMSVISAGLSVFNLDNRQNIDQLVNEHAKSIQTLTAEQGTYLKLLTHAIETQPKPLVRQFRIAFFPEPDSQGYYKFMVNRLLLWAAFFCIMIILYFLVSQFITRAYPDPPLPATPPAQHDQPLQNPSPVEPGHIPSSGQENTSHNPHHHNSRRGVEKNNKIILDTLGKNNIRIVTDTIP